MSEATLAYTVHHKGRKYSAGSTAAQIGPAAAEIGDHAWVDGKGPGPTSASGGEPPPRSPAKGGAAEPPATPTDGEEGGAGAEADPAHETPARRGRRGGGT
jgi:hypothetical protein